MTGIAPMKALKVWMHKERSRWDEFNVRHPKEIEAHRALLESPAVEARRSRVTLLHACRDPEHDHAMIVRESVEAMMER